MYSDILEPFEIIVDDVVLDFHQMHVTTFVDENIDPAKFFDTFEVFPNLIKHHHKQGRSLVGDLILIFRNQGRHRESILMLTINLSVICESDSNGASVVDKTIRHLFDWINQYVDKKKIIDFAGQPFILPVYEPPKNFYPNFAG